jgi:glyoxylase I family protein
MCRWAYAREQSDITAAMLHVIDTQSMEDTLMAREKEQSRSGIATAQHVGPGFDLDFHGVRYQATDVAGTIDFYTRHLGFKLEHAQLPDFAAVSLGALKILLSGPGASGSRPMPSGQHQAPGGWNRVVLRVKDLNACIAELKQAGIVFRNEMETGPAGKQIQIEDPDGNPIELFEPAQRKH